jgi:hypothetical protein
MSKETKRKNLVRSDMFRGAPRLIKHTAAVRCFSSQSSALPVCPIRPRLISRGAIEGAADGAARALLRARVPQVVGFIGLGNMVR